MSDLNKPILDWEGSVPRSRHFDDVYYSRHNGLAESRHVFLAGNHLPERWQHRRSFTIAELGFGTGLNFLSTWQAWRTSRSSGAQLYFISLERYPLDRPILAQAHQCWPELATLAAQLRACWPTPEAGYHIRHLDDQVCLLLLFGDARELLPRLEAQADAWYLDGFSPARNPELWEANLLQQVAQHTAPGGTVATYSAAGQVRRNLMAAGFQMQRIQGFAGKREMLTGQLLAAPETTAAEPWFAPPAPSTHADSATVVGGGLAGTSVARALCQRGWQVTLLERHRRIASEASGNPVGVVMPAPEVDTSPAQRYFAAGFRYTRELLAELDCRWDPCGVLYAALDPAEAERQQRLLNRWGTPYEVLRPVDATDTQALCGYPLDYGGLWFPGAGWAAPDALCQAQLGAAGPRLTLRTHREALQLERRPGHWRVLDAQGRLLSRSPVVVIATGREVASFPHTRQLALRVVRGQLTALATGAASQMLQTVLCGPGYITPPRRGYHWLGATYDEHRLETTPRPGDRQHNLDALSRLHPALAKALADTQVLDRVAFRSTSADRRPMVGGVPRLDDYPAAYGEIWKGKLPRHYPPAPYYPGLYLSAAHGSRGLISAPLAGELLAALICGEPLPLERDLLHALHPGRFAIRSYRRTPRPRRQETTP